MTILAVANAVGVAGHRASADEAAPASSTLAFSGTLTAATDYVYRGFSQSDNEPAGFGYMKASYGQFYAAAGAENVDFHTSVFAEYDLYAGWTGALGGYDLDFGTIRYGYAGEATHEAIDTTEVHGSVTHAIGRLRLNVNVAWTPDWFDTKRDATYIEANAACDITQRLSASLGAGREAIRAGGTFDTWNAGATYSLADDLSLDLRYYDTDQHRLGRRYGSHLVSALTLSF